MAGETVKVQTFEVAGEYYHNPDPDYKVATNLNAVGTVYIDGELCVQMTQTIDLKGLKKVIVDVYKTLPYPYSSPAEYDEYMSWLCWLRPIQY